MTLSEREQIRYSRQLNLTNVGVSGQLKLKSAKILVIGAGGLGHPSTAYLAAAGVGHITLVDGDSVQPSNLHRQILFDESTLDKPKPEILCKKLQEINPEIKIETYNENLTPQNGPKIFTQQDLVLDCTDNFSTRYLINHLAIAANIPLIHASIHQFEGQLSVFAPGGPCYACLYPTPPPRTAIPNCATAGVLGVLPGILGTMQANEALKVLLEIGTPATGRLIIYNALDASSREFRLTKDDSCQACSNQQSSAFPDIFWQPVITELTWQEWQNQSFMNPILVDVRTEQERLENSLEGSLHIPLDKLCDDKHNLPENQEIGIFCQSGARSQQACRFLMKQGFKEAYSIKGGLEAKTFQDL